MEERRIKDDETLNDSATLKLKEDSKTNKIADEIVSADVSNLVKRREIVKMIDNFGKDALELAMQRSKSMSTTISQIFKTTNENQLDNNLSKLEKELRMLDPSSVDFSKVVRGFNKLFSPVTKYFNKLEQEEDNIENIISSLNVGRNILSNDNITLEIEIDRISETIKMLNLEHEIGVKIKEKIQKSIDEAQVSGDDVSKTSFYEEEIIIPLEKKLYDIKEVIIVNEQSAMAMEIIRKNNKELIRNVDRIKNVTLVAVNTAVAVAKSLYNQKVILKKIDALTSSTQNTISKTSSKLKEEAYDISKEINSKEMSIDSLKNAFENAFSEIAQISNDNSEKLNNNKEEFLQIKV